ncbi:MAG: DUF1778 domain-containing protein [Promicromonosporaceae bacterium]|nr:DUF1778 domain-containing protein [Promicromonosporaceae bacterium]
MTVATKDRTLRFRVSSEQDDRLRAAAAEARVTLTDFVMGPALLRADELLARPEVVHLSAAQFDAMLAALENPPLPNSELVALAMQPRRFTRI